jgi:hypothetical protein
MCEKRRKRMRLHWLCWIGLLMKKLCEARCFKNIKQRRRKTKAETNLKSEVEFEPETAGLMFMPENIVEVEDLVALVGVLVVAVEVDALV